MKKNCILRLLSMAVATMTAFAACEKTGNNDDEPETDKPVPPAELEWNEWRLGEDTHEFGSAASVNIGENIAIAACTAEGIATYEEILEQEECFFIAIAPNLNGEMFDPMSETSPFTIMSTLDGCMLETVAPDVTEEIQSGKCLFTYEDGNVNVEVELVLADGTAFAAKISAETADLEVNENTITLNGEEKPVRTVFHMSDGDLTYLYITPAGIDYSEELEITTYYAYLVLKDSKCNGSPLNAEDLEAAGIADNINGIYTDSSEAGASGSVIVKRDKSDPSFYTVKADLSIGTETLAISFSGNAKDFLSEPEEVSQVIFEGEPYRINEVTLDKTTGNGLWTVTLSTTGENVTITMPSEDFDGNAKGFSQFQNMPEVMVKYGEKIYNKASGYSGTITVGITDGTIRIEFTNYEDLEILYEGPFQTIE